MKTIFIMLVSFVSLSSYSLEFNLTEVAECPENEITILAKEDSSLLYAKKGDTVRKLRKVKNNFEDLTVYRFKIQGTRYRVNKSFGPDMINGGTPMNYYLENLKTNESESCN